ncbi:YdcH family protein [Pigmentiphaga sp. YJ18]|uniref:YdcH family protein n=1 Tax=Pigmentiphaga sp. YJ18 TaxID=3134907 RepID=UPI003116B9E5
MDDRTQVLTARIVELQLEHRDLDAAIERLAVDTAVDELRLKRMKKRKLQLKDHIVALQMQLIPDIPA